MKDAWDKLPVFRRVLNMAPKGWSKGACQKQIMEGDGSISRISRSRPAGRAMPAVDHLGPGGDAGPQKERQNLGIYRHAGDRSQPRDHALAGASWRRAGLP